jgi:hypothetical protein
MKWEEKAHRQNDLLPVIALLQDGPEQFLVVLLVAVDRRRVPEVAPLQVEERKR